MIGEHYVVAIAKGELSLLRRTGLLAVVPFKAGRELRAWSRRIRPIDGERYEFSVAALRAMTVLSAILLIAAGSAIAASPHHPALWRPVIAVLFASLTFHTFLLVSLAFRVGVKQNPAWPTGHWLVLQAAALAVLVGMAVTSR
ncbi:hypothetical protein Caci_3242 [Catenulispora acidiphila DSM 44928]|uniref:Uncharacterized protein n=1 Tax=Catenulispora acidiphila (strain DSM 44928 / JCM 14897 / NBRC 102108 / NRRL B-24433 / ID139908) TaxID=479433 RepID=C7Q6E3_CATAD|nr:hypothetical protein [Catenulispora acidiphila]ACU72149.1 hypothetical protein Caci_3242 [Catenulispora acidiphila DSM 44928]